MNEPALSEEYSSESVINPFAGLSQLANIINGLDTFLGLAKERGTDLPIMTLRRLTYMRNTLVVSFELWKDEVQNRVSRSEQKFYVFCMTEGEKIGFQRRMVPSLAFAAEELAALDIKALAHFAGSIAKCGDLANTYANNNKASIRAGIEDNGRFPNYEFQPLRLPEIKT
jgi:hypothetical protein